MSHATSHATSTVDRNSYSRISAQDLGKRIMLVDDSALIRRALRKVFEGDGWVVCAEAANGREAIVQGDQVQPQLIVLDLAMPDINGLTTARRLKRTLPEVKLILFTGHGDLFKANEAVSAGISAVLSKNDPIRVLLDTAKSLVSQTAATSAH
jgi:DNA-binding NarL/FixJ family response regulator